jgi:integrase
MPRARIRGLYKSNGRFHVDLRYRDAQGTLQRFVEHLPPGISLAAAKEHARQLLNRAYTGNLVSAPASSKPLSLYEAFERYVAWCKQNRPKTHRDRQHLVRTLKKHIPDMPVTDLSQIAVERFKRARADEGVKPATINRAVAMLKHFIGRAISEGWITESTGRSVRSVVLLKEPPGRVRYLGDDEARALLEALRSDVREVVVTALLTGMRRGEILNLKKGAIDFDARLIHLTETKTNRARHLPIHDSLVPLLRGACERSRSDFVFTNASGTQLTHRVAAIFRQTVRKLGIQDLRFHDLRHDFATKLRRRGMGLDLIATLLGHSSLAMTQRYAHLGLDELRAAVQQLEPVDAEHCATRSSS